MKCRIIYSNNVSILQQKINDFLDSGDIVVQRMNEIYVPNQGLTIIVWYEE